LGLAQGHDYPSASLQLQADGACLMGN
jgi:hypothetical protein